MKDLGWGIQGSRSQSEGSRSQGKGGDPGTKAGIKGLRKGGQDHQRNKRQGGKRKRADASRAGRNPAAIGLAGGQCEPSRPLRRGRCARTEPQMGCELNTRKLKTFQKARHSLQEGRARIANVAVLLPGANAWRFEMCSVSLFGSGGVYVHIFICIYVRMYICKCVYIHIYALCIIL